MQWVDTHTDLERLISASMDFSLLGTVCPQQCGISDIKPNLSLCVRVREREEDGTIKWTRRKSMHMCNQTVKQHSEI